MSEVLAHRVAAAPGADFAARSAAPERVAPVPGKVHVVRSDAEAIDIAHALAPEFAAEAALRDAQRRLPWDELDRYSASGLGGITVPRAFGGAGVAYATLAEVFRILCAADPSLGQIPQNQFGVLEVIRELGSAQQQARVFAAVLAGERLGNAGPERGTATILHQRTRLTRRDGGLRLSGRRYYSTGALFAHWIPTRALDDEDRPVMLWVARSAPGVRVIDDWSSFGQRTTASGSVVFDDVEVDPDNVVPAWQLADRPGLTGPVSQLIQASIDAGIAAAAIDDTVRFVREHARPWMDSGVARAADDPYVIQAVGRLKIDLHAADAVLRDAARTLDRIAAQPVTAAASADASVAVAQAKILTTEIALAAAEKLFELAGSAATRAQHALDRHWRNARTHTLHDPVRWKYHLIGNHALNGVPPRRHQWN